MKLFDRIVETENEFIKYCDSYNGQNICLFGAGEGAFRIYEYLEKRNIPVACIAVKRDYVEIANKRAESVWGGAET